RSHPPLHPVPTRRSSDLPLRSGLPSFVSAARCRNGEASRVASDAADCERLSRTHNKTHSTGRSKEKAPQPKSLQGLIFTQSGRRDRKSTRLNSSHEWISY